MERLIWAMWTLIVYCIGIKVGIWYTQKKKP